MVNVPNVVYPNGAAERSFSNAIIKMAIVTTIYFQTRVYFALIAIHKPKLFARKTDIKNGDRRRTRTPSLLIRSQALCPVELGDRIGTAYGY